ncbi:MULTISPECIES: hypothetical protein [unclassified Roseateles]|uniref:hypothetical protein n=1 Tax=unclassified Roseateles TaxID=2626991 RepID=UPI0006F3A4F0|nr:MULTISPECIES: hypothetical protein [unclassified Roseateles]KQW51214.1 hypothetical protein ASC81_00730 [Pelomonas sp. Root405]KRA77446.1 hypothetical protein ASD88_00730 [Pelomonas sp. Root662]
MQAVVTTAAHRAIQFPSLFTHSLEKLQPIQRNVQRTDANAVRDSILRCTRQMSGTQSHNRRVKFLSGVEVREISMDAWIQANEAFQPVWFG